MPTFSSSNCCFQFLSHHYGFTNYFERTKFLSGESFKLLHIIFLGIALPEIWSLKNCKIDFFSLFTDFLPSILFEYFEYVRTKCPKKMYVILNLAGIQKQQNLANQSFFFSIFSCHYGFTNFFEILNFLFSNIIPEQVSTC